MFNLQRKKVSLNLMKLKLHIVFRLVNICIVKELNKWIKSLSQYIFSIESQLVEHCSNKTNDLFFFY